MEPSVDKPRIERVSGKLAQLERMAEYREEKLKAGDFRGDGHFLRAEASALRAACDALRYHRADVEGLDDPVMALQELVDALELSGDAGERERRVQSALKRARTVLEEWD